MNYSDRQWGIFYGEKGKIASNWSDFPPKSRCFSRFSQKPPRKTPKSVWITRPRAYRVSRNQRCFLRQSCRHTPDQSAGFFFKPASSLISSASVRSDAGPMNNTLSVTTFVGHTSTHSPSRSQSLRRSRSTSRFAVDHAQNSLAASRDAHLETDAVTCVDRESRLAVLSLIFAGEVPDGRGGFADVILFERRVQTVEMSLRAHFHQSAAAQPVNRLLAVPTELERLELLQVFDRRAHHCRVRPRKRADADRFVGVGVDLLGQHAALQSMRRSPFENRQARFSVRRCFLARVMK